MEQEKEQEQEKEKEKKSAKSIIGYIFMAGFMVMLAVIVFRACTGS